MTERDGKTGRREDSGEKRRMDCKWILKRVTDRNGRWGGERKEDGDDETGRESAQHTLTSTQTNELFAFIFFSPTALIMALQLLICHLSDYCKA